MKQNLDPPPPRFPTILIRTSSRYKTVTISDREFTLNLLGVRKVSWRGWGGGLENSRVHLTNLTSSIRRGQRLFFKSQICAGLIPTDFQPYKLIPKKKNSSTNRNIPLYMRNAGCHWISLSARIAKKTKIIKMSGDSHYFAIFNILTSSYCVGNNRDEAC